MTFTADQPTQARTLKHATAERCQFLASNEEKKGRGK